MPKSIYHFDGWKLDAGRRRLFNPDGTQVHMTSREIDLLTVFCRNPQTTISRYDLLPRIAGKVTSLDRAVDVRVARVRAKIEPNPRAPELIKTIRQEGYWFTPDVTVES